MIIYIIFLTLILGVIIWGGVTQWRFVSKKKEDFKSDIKVAMLIITLNKKWINDFSNDKRYLNERDIWEKYADKNENVDCYFLECDKKEYYETLKNTCNESHEPGIYQKTILSLKNLEKDYDFYIRTNTRMFFIFDNLLKQLKSLKRDKPYLYGEYCAKGIGHDLTLPQYINWAPGWLFVLNKKTKDLIVKKGFDKKYYSAKIPDDVLLGQVLTDNGVKCEKDSTVDFTYTWDSNKSFEENVKNIDNSGSGMIYLNYIFDSNLRKKLVDYYYKREYFNKKFPDYVVCSTSNSPYQNWQCELLTYSFNKVKQGGKLIFLCSDDPLYKDRPLPKFKNAETLKYPNWMIKGGPGAGWYGPRNKPYSMQKWVNTYPNLKDDETVLFLDPDMVFLKPMEIDVSKGVVWGHKWIINGDNTFDLLKKNRELITDDYAVMYPFAMTIGDVKLIVDTYINKCDQILKSIKKWNSEMYGFIMSIADSNLKTKPVNIANYFHNMNENDPKYIIHYMYAIKDDKNNTIFYKQDYTPSTETKPWKRPGDIDKTNNKRDKALLSLIHEYIDQQ